MAYFSDRVDAGKRLAAALAHFRGRDGVVLAIPRGGVVVGYQIADALNLPLDVIIPHKLGAPNNPELAIGAITEDGTTVLDNNVINYLAINNQYIQEESKRQEEEIQRRLKMYRQDMPGRNVAGLHVIIVDDGVATGSTMKAALFSVKNKNAATTTIAIPVGSPTTLQELKQQVDCIICLYTPNSFQAIGQFYNDFAQTSDQEVITLLKENQKNCE
ncbi:phosphoribosyltransferase [Candidatus Bathycorpusculum sp.]|uniref:phosphoribosyltransferase n=1 Tax=Candidatus Bathycorpusculum sp. TaxID=2994959 RepID=UPI00282F1864|nr:phosphoribosyltransferase [Candidatus Termitimicrobium sp.]MCL2432629.1 phosphoribosyltransferase [Candidatus Termitimicrobium sp.]